MMPREVALQVQPNIAQPCVVREPTTALFCWGFARALPAGERAKGRTAFAAYFVTAYMTQEANVG